MTRFEALVPAGTHTYSKTRYPANAPIIVRGKGGRVYDAAGREFIDMAMGINNVLIGHAEETIDDAAIGAIRNGQAFGRPSLLEEQAAEAVLGLFPQADCVKFCKNGSDANNAAIRLARAVTGRQHIAFDESAPFFSTADWFCHRQVKSAGTLEVEREFALTFRFNDVDSVEQAFHVKPLACVILEVCRTQKPTPDFIEAITSNCRRHGTLLVIDEVVTGFRYGLHGAAPLFGLEPDLFTLGKGLANGYSVAALLGKRELMQRGARDGDVFLLSTTNGAEQSGLAAAIATVAFYQKHDVIQRLNKVGLWMADIIKAGANKLGLPGVTAHTDFYCRPAVTMPDAWKETFYRAIIDQGVLWPMTWCCPCFQRTDSELQQVSRAVATAFQAVIREVACG